jgi:hypothetical protein
MVNIVCINRIIALTVAATVLGLAISFIFTDSINVLNIVRVVYLMYQFNYVASSQLCLP